MDDDGAHHVRRVPTRLGSLAVRSMGSGPEAVLWHGLFTDSTSWRDMVPLLAPHRRLHVVDGPGFGRSDPLERASSIDECVGAAVDLVDALGIGPVDWVGFAWGGHIGMSLAALHPERVRSLVAISAPPRPVLRAGQAQGPGHSPAGGRADRPAAQRRRRGPTHRRAPAGPPAAAAAVDSAMRRMTRGSLVWSVRSFALGRKDVIARLPSIAAPALFVATDDRAEFTPSAAEEAASLAQQGQWRVISGARAAVPVEQPAALADVVTAFWAA